MTDLHDTRTTAELRGELFGVHIPELQLSEDDYIDGMRAAALGAGDTYLELGSGHGIGLVLAASRFGARAHGVEYLPDAIERSERRARAAGVAEHVTVTRGDVRLADLSDADVVHMHLGPAFHDVLAARAEQLMRPSARVIAAGWTVPGWRPCTDEHATEFAAGAIYRPADPSLHATWHAPDPSDDAIEVTCHADLWELTPVAVRPDGREVRLPVSGEHCMRGSSVLVALPTQSDAHILLRARCRRGGTTQRGQAYYPEKHPRAEGNPP
jgi:SAM-dependent methyltransferase